MRRALAVLALAATAGVANGEVLVLGLPLGGKIKPFSARCPEDSSAAKSMCWMTAPKSGKGWRGGWAAMPDPTSRPQWAARAIFDLSLDSDWTLREFTVRSWGNPVDIRDSISVRFGRPSDRGIHEGKPWFSWGGTTTSITYYVMADGESIVRFRLAADVQRAAEAADKERRKHPIAP